MSRRRSQYTAAEFMAFGLAVEGLGLVLIAAGHRLLGTQPSVFGMFWSGVLIIAVAGCIRVCSTTPPSGGR